MTNREKIVFLKRFVILDREIDRKVEEVIKWRSRLGKVTAVYSSQPKGGGSIHKGSETDIINRIVDLEQEIKRDIDRLIDARQEISQLIETVTNDKEKLLLQYRYLDGHTWEKIAVMMNYAWAQTHRIHSNALYNLKLIQNDTLNSGII